MTRFNLKFLSLLVLVAGLGACGYYPYEVYEEEIIVHEYDYERDEWQSDRNREWTFVLESYWDEPFPYDEEFNEDDFAMELVTPYDHSLIFENEFVDGCVHLGSEILPRGKREDYITCQGAPSGYYEVRFNNWSLLDRDVQLVVRFLDREDWLTGESSVERYFTVQANETVVSPLYLGDY